jgi:hypothetical protein
VSVDPRLGGNSLGITDPLQAQIAALNARIDGLQRQLSDMRAAPTVQVGAGPPSGAARDGTFYVDTTNSRLYARSAGVWKSALLS